MRSTVFRDGALFDGHRYAGPAEVLVLGSGSQVPKVGVPAVPGRNGTGAAENGVAAPENGIAALENGAAAGPLTELPTVFERTITTDTHEFITSHVLNGRAVLPAAMMLEWLAHGALHGNPGLRFVGVDDLRVFKGVLVKPNESLRIRICADRAQKQGDEFHVVAELCSGGSNGRRVLHARAAIVLTAKPPEAGTAKTSNDLPDLPALDQSIETIYAETLFHGPEMHGLLAVESCGDAGLVARCRVAPPPADWMEEPVRSRWIADPLALDSGLQAMIVWTSDRVGELSLPSRFTRYRQFVPAFPEGGARIVIDVRERTNGKVVSDIDWIAEDVAELKRTLGPNDLTRLDRYLDNVREIERRIEGVEAQNRSGDERELPEAPAGVPDSYTDHVHLMFDLQALAFASDMTRVFSLKLGRDASSRVYPESGTDTPFHPASHHGGREAAVLDFAVINKYHASMLPYLMDKLAEIDEGDTHLLDKTMIIYGSPMADGNLHNHRRCPLVVLGGAKTQLDGNLHIKARDGTPMANVFTSLLHKLGHEDLDGFGDSDGVFSI